MPDRVVLAYSGGLDTSVCLYWLREEYGYEVHTLTLDLGAQPDLEAARQRAKAAGVTEPLIVDAREEFLRDFVFPALKANARYEGQYPLATALSRPLIARHLVEAAIARGASAVAHGCTGKGNDQVRFDVSVAALAPQLKVIAPVRDKGGKLTREEELELLQAHGLDFPMRKSSPYSTDENLWGRSIEAGALEDAWLQPPEDAYLWTKPIEATPNEPRFIEVGFEEGLPVRLDGEVVSALALVTELNRLAGEHGTGRIDHIENRLVGIKSREVYEAPAATVLLTAHEALEALTLSKEQMRFKASVAQQYADLVYNGLWFTAHREDLQAYVDSTQRYVTGTVRVRLHKGNATVVGRRSPYALYQESLATYSAGDTYDHAAAAGFIRIWGLPVRTQTQQQRKGRQNPPSSSGRGSG